MAEGNGKSLPRLTPRGVPGQKMQLGVMEYVLAPVKLAKMKDLQGEFDRLYKIKEGSESLEFEVQGFERTEIIAKFVAASLQRNYDQIISDEGKFLDITPESVLEILDLGTRENAFAAVMALTGLAPLGEALAREEESPPTSLASGTESPSHTEPNSQTA